jgi:hypothetical protein
MDFAKKRKHGDTNAPVESLGSHIAVPSHDSAEMIRKLERLCDFRQQVRLQETAGNVRKRERRGRNNANERYRSLAVAPAEIPGVRSNPHPTLQPAYQPLEPTGMITRRVHRRVPLARRIRRPFNIHARAKKPARGSHRTVVITSGAAAPRSKTTGKRRRDSPRRRKRIVVGFNAVRSPPVTVPPAATEPTHTPEILRKQFGGELTELEHAVLYMYDPVVRANPGRIWMHCGTPEQYLAQFLPHVKENLLCEIASEMSAIRLREQSAPSQGPLSAATYHSLPPPPTRERCYDCVDDGGTTTSVTSDATEDEPVMVRRITLTCPAAQLDRLEHGLAKMAVCLHAPGSRQYVLGIADGPRLDAAEDHRLGGRPDPNRPVEVLVRLLPEAFEALHMSPQLVWHPLCALTTAERLHSACSLPTVPSLLKYTDLRSPVAWPGEALPCLARAQRISRLNHLQRSVVNRLCATAESGIYCLIGPPGTGKTSTIVQLLAERVRCFPTQKILLTAPSNKAVQVVLAAFLRSVTNPPVVACISAPNANVVAAPDVSVTHFIEDLLQPNTGVAQEGLVVAIHTAVDKLSHLLLRPGLLVQDQVLDEVQWLADDLTARAVALAVCAADTARCEQTRSDVVRAIQGSRQSLESLMLQQAQIVFSTLVTCGKASLIRAVPHFDCVVVDEASQAVIPETLILFRFDPALCLLVGDPQQLPGLVHSHRLRELGYEDSLLHTMTQFQQRPYLEGLVTQYRMHPGICSWVSDRFYRGELTADPSLVHRDAPISQLSAEFRQICPPSSFIDCPYMENIYNVQEARILMEVAKYLLMCGVQPEQVGIITFYNAQVELLVGLREQLAGELAHVPNLAARLTISTVDGFQGDERDVTLISCVRTVPAVGFLKDHRRISPVARPSRALGVRERGYAGSLTVCPAGLADVGPRARARPWR